MSANQNHRPEAPVHWVADGIPRIELANQFLAQLDHAGGTPDQVVLTLGQAVDAGTPPTVLSAVPIGRYGLTPARLDDLIMVLLDARQELLGLTEPIPPADPAKPVVARLDSVEPVQAVLRERR
ncbi:hypothetical protein [Asanoa iriomotensis]|uniref:Uncharacterized protein n=1 Tax=Asanoa iriomotensis TaxID=234613 RepID=A0ABQ4CEJ2_9ACTN|nr:hypothetical protein [Asanoa iriomotensis]GIF61194.1 hypothetical protein Air01nite_72890 [Asanoa iriomotensis]